MPPDLPSWYWVVSAALEWVAAMAGMFAGIALARRLGATMTLGATWGIAAFGVLEGLICFVLGRVLGACLLGGFASACLAVAICSLLDCGSVVTWCSVVISMAIGLAVGRQIGKLTQAYETWEEQVKEFCFDMDLEVDSIEGN